MGSRTFPWAEPIEPMSATPLSKVGRRHTRWFALSVVSEKRYVDRFFCEPAALAVAAAAAAMVAACSALVVKAAVGSRQP